MGAALARTAYVLAHRPLRRLPTDSAMTRLLRRLRARRRKLDVSIYGAVIEAAIAHRTVALATSLCDDEDCPVCPAVDDMMREICRGLERPSLRASLATAIVRLRRYGEEQF